MSDTVAGLLDYWRKLENDPATSRVGEIAYWAARAAAFLGALSEDAADVADADAAWAEGGEAVPVDRITGASGGPR